MNEIIICRGGCGTKLSHENDAKPKWYGTFQGAKCISGICEVCYKKEKEELVVDK